MRYIDGTVDMPTRPNRPHPPEQALDALAQCSTFMAVLCAVSYDYLADDSLVFEAFDRFQLLRSDFAQ